MICFVCLCVCVCACACEYTIVHVYMFLNQARAWFLRIASVCECLNVCMSACVCVCPPPKLLITSGVMHTLYDWLDKFYGFIWQL